MEGKGQDDSEEPRITQDPVAVDAMPLTGKSSSSGQGVAWGNPYLTRSPRSSRIISLSRPPPPPARPSHHPESGSDDEKLASALEWGLPADPGLRDEHLVSPELKAKLAQFHELKSSASNPVHFNASLLNNRSFKNPHIYDKLVTFVGIDERRSGYHYVQAGSKQGEVTFGDPAVEAVVRREGDPRHLAELQRKFTEERQAEKAPGKRSRLDFTPASTSSADSKNLDTTSSSRTASPAAITGKGGAPDRAGARMDKKRDKEAEGKRSSRTHREREQKRRERDRHREEYSRRHSDRDRRR